ncbi:CUE domain-containing protein 5-like [Cryptomeria japonica]|uniref:CUE domain-containing protein 5-like n=1 Tax=Cryptomeria japonica TaxID=3369 RepID=UPI0027DA3D0C|nr:CUE domain-containing protein 5-like [Cryptomeria japonica]
MGYEVDASILDAYARILIDALEDEFEKSFGTAKQKELEVKTRFNQKKRERQQKKVSQFVEKVSKDIQTLIDASSAKEAKKRKQLEALLALITSDTKTEDEIPLSFKRVQRKKVEEPKEKAEKTRKQSARKVTIKISESRPAKRKPTQKKRLVKETPGSSDKKNKKEDIDEAIETGNVTIISPMSCAELIDEITKEANPRSDTSDILVDGKGKGVVDSPSTILKDVKELNADSLVEANLQNKEEIQAEKTGVHIEQVIDVEDNSPLDQNEQVMDTTNVKPVVIDTTPSGETTDAKEVNIGENQPEEKAEEKNLEEEKEKETKISVSAQSSEKREEESGREPVARATLFAITTANVEQKSITEMSSNELMMIVAHKMIKEGTKEK